jgi:hypothetical protein
MAALVSIFPDARFLHIIRDGRDVACSLYKTHWIVPSTGKKVDYTQSIGNAARYWRDIIQTARQHAAHPILEGRVLEIRYEALVAETERTLRQVLQFLDEPWHAGVLSHYQKSRQHEPTESTTLAASRPVYDSAIGRWKSEMTNEDKIAFKAEAGPLLAELGYAVGEW